MAAGVIKEGQVAGRYFFDAWSAWFALVGVLLTAPAAALAAIGLPCYAVCWVMERACLLFSYCPLSQCMTNQDAHYRWLDHPQVQLIGAQLL